MALCCRQDAGAVTLGPKTSSEAHELPGVNEDSTLQGCWEPVGRGPQPQAAMQSPAGK